MSEVVEALGKAHERLCVDKLFRKACYLGDICRALDINEIGTLIQEAIDKNIHMNQIIYIALIEGRIDRSRWDPIIHYLSEEDNDTLESVVKDESRRNYLNRFHKRIITEHLESCFQLE